MDEHVKQYRAVAAARDVQRTKQLLSQVNARLAGGGYPSADAYYQDKETARRLSAKLVGKKSWEYDPVGYWHDMQSN